MKIQKTISLDRNTATIAERIPNFSEWVRASLLAFDEEGSSDRPVLKHWLHCDVGGQSHTRSSFNYDRVWRYNRHSCETCMHEYKLGQTGAIGTYSASTTIVEDDDQ